MSLMLQTTCRPKVRKFIFLLLMGFIMLFCTTRHVRAQAQTRQVPVESLIYDLKNPDPVRRKEAAMLLGNNKMQRATPDLVAAAGDADPSVRREIVGALDKMLDIRALPAFVSLSSDPEKDIRDKCIRGLINLYLPHESGITVAATKVASFFNPASDEWADVIVEPGIKVDPSAIIALRNRLQDADDGIREKAVRGLGILKGTDGIPAMLDSLRQDKSNLVRFELVRSLRKIADPTVAKDLMSYVDYSDFKVRNEAVYTVGRMRYRDGVSELTRLYEKESALLPKLIDKTYRELVLDALAFIGDPASKALFAKEKQNLEDLLRLHAVEGLARIGDPSLATEISRDRLREKDSRMQAAQAYALYRMGRKEYLDEVVKAIGSRRTNNEARQYLVELKPDELPDLYAQTKNKEVSVREGLAEVIGLIGDSKAVAPLQELSQDRRGQIAATANHAIRRINARTAGQ